ncbi:hypothetical protein C0431_12275 [bacterium]|nr:hypothetical protein [bacterium]
MNKHSAWIDQKGRLFISGDNTSGQVGLPGTTSNFLSNFTLDEVREVSLGRAHTVVRRTDDTVWAVGSGSHTQNGKNTTSSSVWAQIMNESKQVYAAGDQSFALMKNGDLYGWGRDLEGQLTQKPGTNSMTPILIFKGVKKVSGGELFTVVIKEDGTLWGWGANNEGQLGQGDTTSKTQAVQIMTTVKDVWCGVGFGMAIKNDGSLWAWGKNSGGQLGDGTLENRLTPIKIMDAVRAGSSGVGHTMVIKEEGSLWGWGDNLKGQVGDASSYGLIQKSPVQIGTSMEWKKVRCSAETTFVMGANKRLFAFGDNTKYVYGKARLDQKTNYFEMEMIAEDLKVVDVFVGRGSTFVIKENGTLWAAGEGSNNKLGNGGAIEQRVHGMIDKGVKTIALGDTHGLAIKEDNSLWGWGNGANYRTFGAAQTASPRPEKMLESVKSISCGGGHSLVIKMDGTLWTAGYNTNGELGRGYTAGSTIPGEIMQNVKKVSGGAYHSVALKEDGTVWTWGQGTNGKLGNGLTAVQTSPGQIMTGVKDIVTGANHSLALKDDGTLWAWGWGNLGQLGIGDAAHKSVPTQVMSNCISCHANHDASAAVTADGTIWVWGFNTSGRLGIGTTSHQLTPAKFTREMSKFSFGEVGIGISKDGEFLGWGAQSQYVFGDGTINNYLFPTNIERTLSLLQDDAAIRYFPVDKMAKVTAICETPRVIEKLSVNATASGQSYIRLTVERGTEGEKVYTGGQWMDILSSEVKAMAMTLTSFAALDRVALSYLDGSKFKINIYIWTMDPMVSPQVFGVDALFKEATGTPVVQSLGLSLEMIEASDPVARVSTNGTDFEEVAFDEVNELINSSGNEITVEVELKEGQTLDGVGYSWA